MITTYSPQVLIRLPSVRLYLGLATIVLGLCLEFLLPLLPSDVGSFLYGSLGKGVLNYYLLGLLALVLYKILKTGWDKEISKSTLPSIALAWILAESLQKALNVPQTPDDILGFPSMAVTLTTAFTLSLLMTNKYPWETQVAGLLILGLVIWATLVTAGHRPPDVLGGLGVGLVGTVIVALPETRQTTPYAFGPVLAFRRYELYLLRYAYPAQMITAEDRRQANLKILDIGCGDGIIKKFCSSANSIWHGVDFNPNAVRQAEAAGYTVHQLDLEATGLPFSNETFDVVVMCHCLEHLLSPDRVLLEVDRVCRPGGLLIIGIPIKLLPLRWLVTMSYRYRVATRGRKPGETSQFFTLRQLRTFLHNTLPAYSVEDVRGFRFLSSRESLPLEDWLWFFRFSEWVGKHLPSVTPEVNIALRKRTNNE